MKKFVIALLFAFVGVTLIACNVTTTTTTTTTSASQTSQSSQTSQTSQTTTRTTTQTTLNPFWDEDQNGVEDWQEQTITLRYATWQHTTADVVTIESLMVQAFMDKYPNITVEFVYAGSGEEWDANFMALLETDSLPDVFLINRLAHFLPFNILADITPMYDNDPDTDYIFDSVQQLGIYDNVRYAVPTFIYPQLWIVNLEILEAAGVAIPGYDWTFEQAEAIAQATTNENTHIIGMWGCEYYHRELPKALKLKAATTEAERAVAKSWYAAAYDGFQFNYMDPVFLTAMNKMADAMQGGYCVQGLDAATLEDWYLSPTFQPTYNGKVAMWREASWSAKNYFSQMLFDWDVYPGPDGITGGNTDIAGIASTSQNKKAAYQFLKWMSYGEDGLLTRYQLFEDYSDQVTISANNYGYPVVDYGIDGFGVNKLWETIPYGKTAPGFVSPEFIESLKNGAFWVNKETVGWDEADTVAYAYIASVIYGTATFADIREILNNEANAAMTAAKEALDALLE